MSDEPPSYPARDTPGVEIAGGLTQTDIETIPSNRNHCHVIISFPRSAWECRLRRSASAVHVRRGEAAERPGRHSHAERGNELVDRNSRNLNSLRIDRIFTVGRYWT